MNTNKGISILTALLVAIVALGAFALSYSALRDMATRNGIIGFLSYVWPLLIDFSLIVFSLSVVNSYLQAESTKKQWALVAIYTIATIGFNVAHAPSNLEARIVAAIAPISLFFSFEILMAQLRNRAKRSNVTNSIEQLEAILEKKQSEFSARLDRMRLTLRQRFEQERSMLSKQLEQLDLELTGKRSEVEQLTHQIEEMSVQKVKLGQAIAELHKEKKATTIVQQVGLNEINGQKLNDKQTALNALLTFYRSNPLASLAEAGRAIDRSKSTISGYLGELEQAGLIHRNGEGIEVLQ